YRFFCFFFFFKQKTAYEIDCDWSSDVCSSDLPAYARVPSARHIRHVLFVTRYAERLVLSHRRALHVQDSALARLEPLDGCAQDQIGRASCREREWVCVEDGACKASGGA